MNPEQLRDLINDKPYTRLDSHQNRFRDEAGDHAEPQQRTDQKEAEIYRFKQRLCYLL